MLMLMLMQTSLANPPAEYNSFVKLESGDLIYNGVNVADGFILTEFNPNAAEYKATFFGANGNRMQLQAVVVKEDLTNRLTLLQYNKPSFIVPEVQVCKISSSLPYACNLQGWSGNNVMVNFAGVIIEKELNILGFGRPEFYGLAMMNNKELVGMGVAKSSYRIYWINGRTINDFVFGKQDE